MGKSMYSGAVHNFNYVIQMLIKHVLLPVAQSRRLLGALVLLSHMISHIMSHVMSHMMSHMMSHVMSHMMSHMTGQMSHVVGHVMNYVMGYMMNHIIIKSCDELHDESQSRQVT